MLHKMVDGKKVMMTPEEEKEIRAEWAETDRLMKLTKYKEDRKQHFPSLQDQFDLIWHDINEGKFDKTGKFYQSISYVKSKFPKG